MVEKTVYLPSLIGGATAGLVVDISLFPLDTIKTRLQSVAGFQKAGGFKGIYKGIGPQVIGSAPTAALFFLTYESFKYYTTPFVHPNFVPIVHMTAASMGETVACVIRVPVEIVKQRRQTLHRSSLSIFKHAIRTEGIAGLYRGFGTTVLREIPFAFVQFPIYEYLKVICSRYFKEGRQISSWEAGLCGAAAGGVSAAVTTPLDVVKTRIMLATNYDSSSMNTVNMLKTVYHQNGFKGLFVGFVPRVMWITIGGAIFFGAYDFSRNLSIQWIS